MTLVREGSRARAEKKTQYGMVYQGARYEGLITTFVEYLGAYGGRILDGRRVVVNSEPALRALTEMRDQIYRDGVVPRAVLTWQEEQTRFAFQNGQAAFMRNWPYAYPLMQDTAESRVAGKFSVAPMPAGPGRIADRLGGWRPARHQSPERAPRGGLGADQLSYPAGADARASYRRGSVSHPHGCV